MSIKSVLGFLEEKEGKEREVKAWIAGKDAERNSHHSEQPWHSWGLVAGAWGRKQRLVCQEPGMQIGGENQLGKKPWR